MNPGPILWLPVREELDSDAAWPRLAESAGSSHDQIRIGHTNALDVGEAVRDLHGQLFQPQPELVIFFSSSEYDLRALAREINTCFEDTQVVGCSTAGEIGPLGYLSHSLCGVSFPAGSFTAVAGRINGLEKFDVNDGEALVGLLLERLEILHPGVSQKNMFAFQMLDGLAAREELVTRAFQRPLGDVAIVGGSAGDDGRYAHTYVFEGGRFHEDGAVLVVAATSLPFMPFYTQHLVGTEWRGVVTSVTPDGRTVLEIDALPAMEGYARLFGAHAADVEQSFFASHPLVVRINGADYGRCVRSVNPDGSLTFQCAVEEGLVLRAAGEDDLVRNLESAFGHVKQNIPDPSAVLICDGFLRSKQIARDGLGEQVAEVFRRHHAVGFVSYGGQWQGIHMNQALTGLAFGRGT